MSDIEHPIDYRQCEKMRAWLTISYERHTQPGTYTVDADGGSAAELVSVADVERPPPPPRTCARFHMVTPAVQGPDTHWLGQFTGKGEISEHIPACTGLEGDPPPRLLKILRDATILRDWCATQYVWYAVKRYAGKPPLGLADLRMSTELIHFLLFNAQVPDLFCAIVHEHDKTKGGQWYAGMDRDVHKDDEGEIVPLVAALMETVHYVKRIGGEDASFNADVEAHKKEREGWEGHGYAPANGWWRSEVGSPPGYGHDTWWHRALTLLIPALPRQPNTFYRYHGTSCRPMAASLLERAVLCSELSTVVFELLVTNCEFRHSDVACALHDVLFRGNVRGPTAVRLTSVLYAMLWHARSMPVHDPPPGTWSTRYLEHAWEGLFLRGACQQVVPLYSTKARKVTVPFDYEGGSKRYGVQACTYDAAYYAELAQGFFGAHYADMSRKGDREALIKIYCHAMRCAIQMGQEMTYLVDLLVQHAQARGFLAEYFRLPGFLQEILMHHHAECWKEWVEVAYKDLSKGDAEQKALWDKVTCEAMKHVVENRVRHAVDALLDAIVFLPPGLMTSAALARFVRCMCCPTSRTDDQCARQPTADAVRLCWQVLDRYLLVGGPKWDREVLEEGLWWASDYQSGAAVEVFLSAPYHVEPPKDDHFSLAIVGALLAPGEKAALAPKEKFDKRKFGEVVAEE